MSHYVVNKFKDKNFRNQLGAIAFISFTLGSFAGPSNAIPPEYGEAANNIINEAGKAAGQAGPTLPPIGQVQGNIPDIPGAGVPEGARYYIPAMPIEQQRAIAAQQARHVNGAIKPPATPPIFWSPKKPVTDLQKLRSTMIFTVSTAGVCSQAGWNPIAQIMCASGLPLGSLAISKPAIFRMFAG